MDKRVKVWAALAAALLALLAALSCFAFELGDSGENVSRLQSALYALGYLADAPDGVYGEKTRQAAERLTAYARALGMDLREEELADALSQGRLTADGAAAKPGDVSEAVLLLQRRLRALGYLPDKADGRFGDNTLRALILFQMDAGIARTGELDAATRGVLFRADAAAAKYSVLYSGMRGERVRQLQERMWVLGFFSGDLDGQYGKQTVEGVKALERYVRASGQFGWDETILRLGATGAADALVLETLFSDFPTPDPMALGDEGQGVYRLQRRLTALGYLDRTADGGFGEDTQRALKAFQERAGLKASGDASQDTLALLFSEQAPEAVRPYKLVIDLDQQKLFVYGLEGGEYTRLLYTMACSAGPDAAAGSYRESTRPDARWMEVEGLGWVADCFLLEGSLYVHSTPYDRREGDVDTARLSALGSPAQAGGVMLSPENARLIFQKCPARTPVEIVGTR